MDVSLYDHDSSCDFYYSCVLCMISFHHDLDFGFAFCSCFCFCCDSHLCHNHFGAHALQVLVNENRIHVFRRVIWIWFAISDHVNEKPLGQAKRSVERMEEFGIDLEECRVILVVRQTFCRQQ